MCHLKFSPEGHRVPIIHTLANTSYFLFEAIVIRMGVNWYLIVLYICMALMTNDSKLLFKWPFVYLLWRIAS